VKTSEVLSPTTTPESVYPQSAALQARAHQLIPGGCHTYAKGDDQYPVLAPAFLARGQGCHVWDVDGNEFIEYGMGLRSVTLGHAYPSVVEAAYRQMLLGNNYTRPAPIEIDCAEALLRAIEAAEMVKFAKNGSDVTTAAVKLARAYTGRDIVAICAEHPFFSVDDWFIGSTPMAAGIPEAIRQLTVKFHYNSPQSLTELFRTYPSRIACVMLEAETSLRPEPGFLEEVQRLCAENGALFVLDETLTGFRWDLGGAQKVYGLRPDLSTFGKGLGNGFAIAALAGKREFMERGGLRHSQERVFLLSTTHGAENHALAAAMATLRTYREEPVIETLHQQGDRLRNGANQAIHHHGLEGHVEILGRSCNLVYATRGEQRAPSQAFRALFLQELIRRGVIAPSLVVSYSHSDQDIDQTIDAIAGALGVYRKALDDGIAHHLVGRPVKPVFRPFN